MKEISNLSIRNKLVFIQSLTAFFAVLLCAVIFVYNDIKVFKESSVRKMYSVAQIIGDNSISALEFMDKETANEILLNLDKERDIKNATILDSAGNVFAEYIRPGSDTTSFASPDITRPMYSEFSGQKLVVTYRIYQEDEFLGTLLLRAELTDLNAIIYNYVLIGSLVLVIGLLAAVFISILLQRVISDRLLLLVSKTKKVSQTGDYSIRMEPQGKDEITTLSIEFNNMLAQIQKMEDELKGTNIQLDKRVKARTIELETANSKLQTATEELKHSNSELEQFAYVASHDLQEPLRTITNFVGLVNTSYKGRLDPEADKYLGYILNATARMQNLIRDLLEFSRIGNNVLFEKADCNAILESVKEELGSFIAETGAQINSGKLPVLTANHVELKRLFQNLITNAIKFRRKNVIPRIDIAVEENTDEYHFSFTDNGIGIEDQYKERIFIIFQRLHSVAEYPGTGIGLATCKKIVTLHNGKIWLESKINEGATFHFTISKSIHTLQLQTLNEKGKMHIAG